MKQKSMQLYSPHPPEAYGKPGSIGHAHIKDEMRTLWNLYWLSEPRLDEFLIGGPFSKMAFEVWRACKATLDQPLAGGTVRTAIERLPAAQFVEIVATDAQREALAVHRLLGTRWVTTMRERAPQVRGITAENGNVTVVQFGGASRRVTDGSGSAIIMPLASRDR